MATISPLRARFTAPATASIAHTAQAPLARRLTAEALGTALLIAVVIGAGVHAHRLSNGDATWTLLAQSLAGGGGLCALLLALGPISGAHLNPAVSLSAVVQRSLCWREGLAYVVAQLAGAVLGAATAHAMYGMPAWSSGTHDATGVQLWWSESVATFGLVVIGITCARREPERLPFAVAAYIAAGYWFTASSSLANPALTLACALTNGPSGLRPGDVPGYMLAQCMAALVATPLARWMIGPATTVPQVAAPQALEAPARQRTQSNAS